MESDTKPSKHHFQNWEVFMSLLGVISGAIVFAFMTFVTKSELEAKQRVDDRMLEVLQRDLVEVKQDVKELLKQSKR